jgi:Zn-dependent peptidase ImmA (M78 family)/DNA-binding XRE family transcriptional regulator
MSSQFNGDLLVVAREMRGMSQAFLAEQSGVTQGNLSKIENALTQPSSETITSLAETLDFPETFFMQSQRIYRPLSIHRNHRKKATLSQRKLDQVHAELSVRLINIKRLLLSVKFSPSLPLPQFDIVDYEGDAERIAELVRRTWRLPQGPLDNLTQCVEKAGILVVKCNFSELPVDGITLFDPEAPPCVFLNIDQPADRERFTLAHELGHIVMHAIPTEGMEEEAHEFASALLMPAADIRPGFVGKITLVRLTRLKPVWKVSIQSLVERAKNLKMITPNQHQYLWKQINFLKIRRREPARLDFAPEEPKVFPDLVRMHLTTLGYSVADLLKILHLHEPDFRRLYDFTDPSGQSRHLRVIC